MQHQQLFPGCCLGCHLTEGEREKDKLVDPQRPGGSNQSCSYSIETASYYYYYYYYSYDIEGFGFDTEYLQDGNIIRNRKLHETSAAL